MASFTATVSTTIISPVSKVWTGLTDPEAISQYMFGAKVSSEWKEGSPITWKGEWKGKPYEDKGVIKTFNPGQTLAYTHFSPLAGKPDAPENYHTVTIALAQEDQKTKVTLSQDNNNSPEEQKHSEGMWKNMLEGLKKYCEQTN